MPSTSFNADDIILQIDAGGLRPVGDIVARVLLNKIGFQHDIISRYDRGERPTSIDGHDPLWQQINALPVEQQGALRLVASLVHEGEIDWYASEYFIQWARQEGLSEQDIGEAFGILMSGN